MVASGQGPGEDATSGLATDGDAAAGVLRLGLVADPGLPAEVAGKLAAGELAEALSELMAGVAVMECTLSAPSMRRED